ncbi:hypothetical protein [Streptomyces sp. NPDC059092]|uniref:hypothetical protein n=1 Tax=Streptomyces sp. NPDC059092 TaxID=3346725 RepID=UPI0036C8030F
MNASTLAARSGAVVAALAAAGVVASLTGVVPARMSYGVGGYPVPALDGFRAAP